MDSSEWVINLIPHTERERARFLLPARPSLIGSREVESAAVTFQALLVVVVVVVKRRRLCKRNTPAKLNPVPQFFHLPVNNIGPRNEFQTLDRRAILRELRIPKRRSLFEKSTKQKFLTKTINVRGIGRIKPWEQRWRDIEKGFLIRGDQCRPNPVNSTLHGWTQRAKDAVRRRRGVAVSRLHSHATASSYTFHGVLRVRNFDISLTPILYFIFGPGNARYRISSFFPLFIVFIFLV